MSGRRAPARWISRLAVPAKSVGLGEKGHAGSNLSDVLWVRPQGLGLLRHREE